jgi:hypothetical protein
VEVFKPNNLRHPFKLGYTSIIVISTLNDKSGAQGKQGAHLHCTNLIIEKDIVQRTNLDIMQLCPQKKKKEKNHQILARA